MESDAQLARRLQEEEERAVAASYRPPTLSTKALPTMSPVDPEWETLDPNPDLHSLFVEFNTAYFWGKLVSCEVKWSPRMTTCAGICRYSPREGHCSIGMSTPLLKLRPRKDMVETLLHEMIHAYLFVTQNNRDRDGHGPEFHKHMYRINAATGASISVYHSFHDEVAVYKQHWWRCNGPCTKRPPFYGFVKRAMNRAPGPNDRWWAQHTASCGGDFVKVKEPEKQVKSKDKEDKVKNKGQRDIRDLIKGKENRAKPKGLEDANMVRNKKVGGGEVNNIGGFNSHNPKPSVVGGGTTKVGGGPGAQGGGGRGNIFGFGGTSFGGPSGGGGGLKTKGKAGAVVVNPGWKTPADNSSGGSVVKNGSDLPAQGAQTSGRLGSSSGGGFKLGSSGSPPSGSSVQEMLRKKWGGGDSSRISPTVSADPVKKYSSGPTTSKTPPSNSKNSTSSETFDSGAGPIGTQKQQCPICFKFFPAEEINPHLDLVCLADNSAVFDDDCSDADLAAAAQLVEEEEDRINSSKISIHSMSDSDDDEPLVKRARDDKRQNQAKKEEYEKDEDLFGDTTLQDDLDLLAALEDVTMGQSEGETSMFACPVCDTLLDHAAMNKHLDTCLS